MKDVPLAFQVHLGLLRRRLTDVATVIPGWLASATTRFLNESLQRRREVLGRDAMTVLPVHI